MITKRTHFSAQIWGYVDNALAKNTLDEFKECETHVFLLKSKAYSV